jgi:hypothetical protein
MIMSMLMEKSSSVFETTLVFISRLTSLGGFGEGSGPDLQHCRNFEPLTVNE